MILRSIRNEAGTVPRGGGKTATVAKGRGRRAGGPQAAGYSFTRTCFILVR